MKTWIGWGAITHNLAKYGRMQAAMVRLLFRTFIKLGPGGEKMAYSVATHSISAAGLAATEVRHSFCERCGGRAVALQGGWYRVLLCPVHLDDATFEIRTYTRRNGTHGNGPRAERGRVGWQRIR